MFIARTRFSLFLPSSNGWNISRNLNSNEIDKYKSILFEDSTLNFRINFLSNIALPLMARANENYELLQIIEYSDCLPPKYILLLKT